MSSDKDLDSVQQARELVEAAHRAQADVVLFDQPKIDRICEAMARAALRESARLGALAVEETGCCRHYSFHQSNFDGNF